MNITNHVIHPPSLEASPNPNDARVITLRVGQPSNLRTALLLVSLRYVEFTVFDFVLAVAKTMYGASLGRWSLRDSTSNFDLVREFERLCFSRVTLSLSGKLQYPDGWPGPFVFPFFDVELPTRERHPCSQVWMGRGSGPLMVRLNTAPRLILDCAQTRGRLVAARASRATIGELFGAALADADNLDLVMALAERRDEFLAPNETEALSRLARPWVLVLDRVIQRLDACDRAAGLVLASRSRRGRLPPLSRTPGLRWPAAASTLAERLAAFRAAHLKLSGCFLRSGGEAGLGALVLGLPERFPELVASRELDEIATGIERACISVLAKRHGRGGRLQIELQRRVAEILRGGIGSPENSVRGADARRKTVAARIWEWLQMARETDCEVHETLRNSDAPGVKKILLRICISSILSDLDAEFAQEVPVTVDLKGSGVYADEPALIDRED